jgi:hypothetical protein
MALQHSQYTQEAAVEETIGIIGQAVLVVMGLALLACIVYFLLFMTRAIVRLCWDIWPPQPNQPYTDAYIPEAFDRMRRN